MALPKTSAQLYPKMFTHASGKLPHNIADSWWKCWLRLGDKDKKG
jgi:hypothetical protein